MSALASKPIELRIAGVKALMDVLGDADAQAFLKLWRGTPGRDFNRWLKAQPEKSLEEALEDFTKTAEADITSGEFANKIADAETVGA